MAIDDVLAKLLRKHEHLTLVDGDCQPRDYISTGLPSVDLALGSPGIACGRLTTIVGQRAAGKSTLLYRLMAECQRRGGIAVLLETEDAVLEERLYVAGCRSRERIYIVQPDTVEDALDAIDAIIRALRESDPDALLLLAWDSLAATPARVELGEDAGKATMGGHAKLMSQALRKYTRLISRDRVALVIVNQYREKVGGLPFADNRTMIADAPLGFHSTHILEVARVATTREAKGADPSGVEIEVSVRKNKLAPPFRRARVAFDFTHGFDVGGSWLDAALATGVVTQHGSFYRLAGGEKALPRRDVIAALLANPELQRTIYATMFPSLPSPTIPSVDDLDGRS